jgi:hypothetical protein
MRAKRRVSTGGSITIASRPVVALDARLRVRAVRGQRDGAVVTARSQRRSCRATSANTARPTAPPGTRVV